MRSLSRLTGFMELLLLAVVLVIWGGSSDAIRFDGNTQSIDAYVSLDNLLMNNVSTSETFKPLADVQGNDLNPAVTDQTRIDSLFGGQSLELGAISVTVDVGGGPVTHEVDLTTTQTVEDLRTRLEAPFAGDLSVYITSNGLQLTPAAGTGA